MGSFPSKSYKNNEWEEAKKRATLIYSYRIKTYDPIEHGPPTFYMRQIKKEYDLECIPQKFI